ncbi:MAG: ribonuclease G [Gammaproteobacteria bacterium]|nr:MAG: ribonuclease G [Gammaproteobacteria bacterium]
MSSGSEILINQTLTETRVALLENGLVQEVLVERSAGRSLVGNIYLGKVERVLPGMEAAFINIGLERSAFLHVSDLSAARKKGNGEAPLISEYLAEGKKLVVQIVRAPVGSKGARVTTELTLPARYMVFVPNNSRRGVSQRIEDEAERERLLQSLAEALTHEPMEQTHGFIVRTVAEGMDSAAFAADLRFLKRLWAALQRRVKLATGPRLLYEDLALGQRVLRDMAREDATQVLVDNSALYDALKAFCEDYVPEIASLVRLYTDARPLFEQHNVEADIARALERTVPLKSGGYLVFDQGEAMTTIDVNTGSFVRGRNLEETVFKTNLEAAVALARQVRLRNLGGIIIVDFIDMCDVEHQRQVLRALNRAMQNDSVRHSISGVSDLGLVEMTRKRSRDSLQHSLCETCPTCAGRGVVRSCETVCYDIFREIQREGHSWENHSLMVLASQAVVDYLHDEASACVADLEESIGKTLKFRVEPLYTQEQFDIVLL